MPDIVQRDLAGAGSVATPSPSTAVVMVEQSIPDVDPCRWLKHAGSMNRFLKANP